MQKLINKSLFDKKRGWDKTSLLDEKTDCINEKFDAVRFFDS